MVSAQTCPSQQSSPGWVSSLRQPRGLVVEWAGAVVAGIVVIPVVAVRHPTRKEQVTTLLASRSYLAGWRPLAC